MMATLDDIRAAGFEVALAWESDIDVYAIKRPASQPDPAKPDYDPGSLSFLPDDPEVIASFLQPAASQPSGGSP